MDKFKAGDEVMLKSGSAPMTVVSVFWTWLTGQVKVTYYDGQEYRYDKIKETYINKSVLKHIK